MTPGLIRFRSVFSGMERFSGADFDGVVVVPRNVEAEVFAAAREKAGKETASRKELLSGRTLRQVYDKYRVL